MCGIAGHDVNSSHCSNAASTHARQKERTPKLDLLLEAAASTASYFLISGCAHTCVKQDRPVEIFPLSRKPAQIIQGFYLSKPGGRCARTDPGSHRWSEDTDYQLPAGKNASHKRLTTIMPLQSNQATHPTPPASSTT